MSVYFLNSDEALTKEQIGGKGYYLHQMHQEGLPVPEAAFLSTQLWKEYRKDPEKVIKKLKKEIIPQMIEYFKEANGGELPLVSVRSAGAVSMPGMMDTVLNVGLTQKFFKSMGVPGDAEAFASTSGLESSGSEDSGVEESHSKSSKKATKKTTKKPAGKTTKSSSPDGKTKDAFAADVYARFLTMYGETVLGVDKSKFTVAKNHTFESVAEVQAVFEEIYQKAKVALPSQKPEEQLLQCILAVFNSWDNDRAKLYRQLNQINDNAGTAVVIQRMVFGNKNDLSATGVLFSRNPSNGKNEMTGEYLVNAQGEDVVSGSHTPINLDEMKEEFPEIYQQLSDISQKLEAKYKQMQDIEFTVENGKLFILQARTAKCSPYAKLKMLMDMYKIREISAKDVLENLSLQEYLDLNVKQVDPSYSNPSDGLGLPASMGAMSGRVVFEASSRYQDDPVIFVATETTPDDLEAIQMSQGVLTATGGVTSHAAVVARGMGKICVVGCNGLKVDHKAGQAKLGDHVLKSGDWVTMDATTGKVWAGKDVPILDAKNTQIFWDLEDLVIDAHPGWTEVTSKVDELMRGRSTYFLTYALDDLEEDEMQAELSDAHDYLTGVLDLTGKLDYLENKYPKQFLFTELNAEKTFLAKKRVLSRIARDGLPDDVDFKVYLGPYEQEHASDFRNLGYKILPKSEVSFDGKTKATYMITQKHHQGLPDQSVAISARNALLSVLK